MSNENAAEAVLEAVGGLLEAKHEALVQAFRSLARAVDADPSNAALWREWRAVESSIREILEAVGDDDAYEVWKAGWES